MTPEEALRATKSALRLGWGGADTGRAGTSVCGRDACSPAAPTRIARAFGPMPMGSRVR